MIFSVYLSERNNKQGMHKVFQDILVKELVKTSIERGIKRKRGHG